MKKKSCIFIYFLLTACLSFSQQYNFHNYSVKDGVAQSQVYSLLQDSRGFLWMGTAGGGLSRFDGLNFKTFSVNDGLVNNYVNCIKEDQKYNLWIATNNGISGYNGISFTNYQPYHDSVQLIVFEIDIDKKGRKWLATSSGVMMLENTIFTNISDLLKEKRTIINCIHIDKSGSVWYGTANGLYKISVSASRFSLLKLGKKQAFGNYNITTIREDKNADIWFGTYGDGAWKFDGLKCIRLNYDRELNQQTIWDIYFDKRDNIWFATLSHGFGEYNSLAKSFSWLTENEGLSNNHVRCIIQDKSGNYWFGTSGGGVCNYLGKQFTNYDKTSGLAGNFIYFIYRDSKNRLWISTSGKGLSVLNNNKFYYYNAGNGFMDVKVKSIIEDNSGNLYFGTEGQGAFIYNGRVFRTVDGLRFKFIRAMAKDKNGNIWFATAGAGLYKLTSNSFNARVLHFTSRDGLLHDRLSCLHCDRQGRLWYGTENEGLGYLENDRIQKQHFTRKNGLPSSSIRCMTEDESGYLWIGTADNGIASFPLYQGAFIIKSYNHTNGLTSSNIYLLATDRKNNLFAGTESGLDYIFLDKNRKPVNIKHYSKGEGFTGVETCQNSVCRDLDGTMWFGTINGLSKYSPGNMVKNENEAVTTITDVKLFYESIANTEFRNFAGDWNVVSFLKLPYHQNHLTFEFSAINFSNPDAVKYRWKLEGFDKQWSPVSKNHSILYSNLNPGDYIFLVKACNEDGIWNKEAVALKFHISAPAWRRWWFLVLITLFVFGMFYVFFKWRINRIKAKAAEEQEKLQLEKTVMELEQKALRLQMNPHFIFNALNSIQSQIGNNNEQTARYYLAKFSRLMRQILDNSRSSAITIEEEVNTLENYLLIEKFCNGDRFDYKIIVDPAIEKDFVKIPPMLLQPFIENSIKHGFRFKEIHADSSTEHPPKGLIEVEFKETNNILECILTDNGIGRVKSEELNQSGREIYHKSTALFVTKGRLNLLKQDKSILSPEIIDMVDEQGKACGTKVIVRIAIE